MKKINPEVLEKFAKSKNIDKNKIEEIADGYKGKSEGELMDELVKLGKNLQGKDEVVSKFKAFLDEDQRKKLDTIMNKISNAESKEKIQKKAKPKKTQEKKIAAETSKTDSTPKKTKKVVKKIKKSKGGN